MGKIGFCAAALLCGGLSTAAFAEYPDRQITLVIPSSAGASTDIGVRTWIPYMEKCLGNGATIVPINMQGAGGQVAFAHMSSQTNDGYTLGLFNLPNLPIAVVTKPDVPYTLDSFEYLSNYYTNSPTFSVRKDSDITSLADLFDRAHKAPVNLGIVAIDSEDIFIIRDLEKLDPKLQLVPVPLGGGPQVLQGLLGGHVDVALVSVSNSAPARDELRTLAVASRERVEEELPGVPTFKELGYDIVFESGHLIGAPKGIPEEAKAKLTNCFETIKDDPAFLAEARKRGMLVRPMTSEEATAAIKKMTEDLRIRWKEDPWIK